jgi:hypothetical protein
MGKFAVGMLMVTVALVLVVAAGQTGSPWLFVAAAGLAWAGWTLAWTDKRRRNEKQRKLEEKADKERREREDAEARVTAMKRLGEVEAEVKEWRAGRRPADWGETMAMNELEAADRMCGASPDTVLAKLRQLVAKPEAGAPPEEMERWRTAMSTVILFLAKQRLMGDLESKHPWSEPKPTGSPAAP